MFGRNGNLCGYDTLLYHLVNDFVPLHNPHITFRREFGVVAVHRLIDGEDTTTGWEFKSWISATVTDKLDIWFQEPNRITPNFYSL